MKPRLDSPIVAQPSLTLVIPALPVIPRPREESRTCPLTPFHCLPLSLNKQNRNHRNHNRMNVLPGAEGPLTLRLSKGRAGGGPALPIRRRCPDPQPSPITLSFRGPARNLGLAHSRPSLPPHPPWQIDSKNAVHFCCLNKTGWAGGTPLYPVGWLGGVPQRSAKEAPSSPITPTKTPQPNIPSSWTQLTSYANLTPTQAKEREGRTLEIRFLLRSRQPRTQNTLPARS